MADWEEKLGAILNDPQAMGQILSLARSLDGEEAPPKEEEPGGPEPETPPGMWEGLDPRLMAAGMGALAAWQEGDDRRTALLRALEPFVRPERQEKLERAVRAVRLSRAIRAALEGMREGED